ncbi:hypothetical protein ACB098_11G103500 [Castanea mollissima]
MDLRACSSKTKRTCTRKTNLDDLPDDLLLEILCRVPITSVLTSKYNCVSRRWYSLISSSYFFIRLLDNLGADADALEFLHLLTAWSSYADPLFYFLMN